MLGILSPALKLQFKSNKMPTSRIAGCVAACQRQLRGRSQLMTDAACGWGAQGGGRAGDSGGAQRRRDKMPLHHETPQTHWRQQKC